MRKIIWIVILVILIVLFAIIMIDHNPPIIMLQFGSKTYSTKFLNVVLVALVCLIILYFIISIFKMIFKFPGKVKDSIGLKRDSKQQQDFINGIECYLKGESVDLYMKLYGLFNDTDFNWRVSAGMLLLSDIAKNGDERLDKYYGKNHKKLINELESLDLTESQKYFVKELSFRIMSSSGKVLPAAVVAENILDDTEINYNLPKTGLSQYIRVLLSYGELSCKSLHNETVKHFIEKIDNNIWLQKIISKKKVYDQIKDRDLNKLIKLVSEALILLFNHKANKQEDIDLWLKLGESCDLVDDNIFKSYLLFYVKNKNKNKNKNQINDSIKNKLMSYLKSNSKTGVSDDFLVFIAKSSWLSEEDKLTIFESYISRLSSKPTSLSLCLMGDICLSNNLEGKAMDNYDKSLHQKSSIDIFVSLANFYLLKKNEKEAIKYYQQAFDMLSSK